VVILPGNPGREGPGAGRPDLAWPDRSFDKGEKDMEPIEVTPIGHVVSERKEPRDDHWDSVRSSIQLDPQRFSPAALAELDSFSHLEVVFYMHRVKPEKIQTGARHPRNNPDWPAVGIFAQRGKNRPNQIGTAVCRLDRLDGLRIEVSGLDAIDGTPVLDIKPWVREFGPRGDLSQPEWMTELMKNYWS